MQYRKYIYLIFAVCSTLVGCVSTTTFKTDVANNLNLPDNDSFSIKSNEHNFSKVIGFNNLQINKALIEFIEEVLRKKPSWLGMLEKVKQAEAKAGYNIDDSNPKISSSVGWIRGKENTRESGFRTQNIPSIQSKAKFSWEIDLWGKWKAEKKEAYELLKAESYTKEAAKLF